MPIGRLWAIIGGAVALVVVIIVVLVLISSPTEPDAAPATPSPTAPAAEASPSPTPSPTPVVALTCEDVLTEEFLSAVAEQGGQTWSTADLVGPLPFADFPNGAPDDQVVCRTGDSPDAQTDNTIDHAWAPISPDDADAAIQQLEALGYERTDDEDGVYLSLADDQGLGDADGWGDSYEFTEVDVRWSQTRADLAAIRPADEIG